MRNLPITVRQLAELVGGKVDGDASVGIEGLASVESAGPADLTYAADERRAKLLGDSKAGAAIVGAVPASAPMALIRVANVQAAVAKVLGHIAEPEDAPPAGVHPTAVVSPDARIGADVGIGPGVVVAAGATIGDGCRLYANVSIGSRVRVGAGTRLFEGVVVKSDCVIGSRVRIGPNSVIGWDGFGYYFAGGVHHKLAHVGNVVIEDDVELGACTCVDRAKFGSTSIGAGSKMDNLVQIGHNVQTGRGCLLCGQSGVAGSTRLGNYVVIGGNAGIRDNITLGDGVQCTAFAAVSADVPAGQTVAGIPAAPAREMFRIMQAQHKLPELLKRVKQLEEQVQELQGKGQASEGPAK